MVDPKVPRDVAEVVDTALQFEREDRYPDALAMRLAIERIRTAKPARENRFTVAQESSPVVVSPSSSEASDEGETGLATGMSHHDSVALYKIMRLIQDALQARAANGPWHPPAIGKLDVAYRQTVDALGDAHIGLFWNVVPEGFVAREQFVWMPKPPSPRTPAQMHDGGVRMLGLLAGITKAEFELVARMIGGEIAPFTDYATFLHSSQLEHVVYRIDPTMPGMPEHESVSIEPSSMGGVPLMLRALGASEDGALRVTLLSRLERWGAGHEREVGKVVETAGVELAMGLLRVLHVTDSGAAREAMELATRSPHPIVRIQALAYLDADERLDAELCATFEASDPHVRFDALVNLEKYKVAAAAPALGLHIRAESFDSLPLEERRQALSALGALAPRRAEAIAMELLGGEGLEPSEPHEATREAAAELLGSIGESDKAREALEAAARDRRPGAERVRHAATTALDTFEANLWRVRS